VSSSG